MSGFAQDHISLYADDEDEFNSHSEDHQDLAPEDETHYVSEIHSNVSSEDMRNCSRLLSPADENPHDPAPWTECPALPGTTLVCMRMMMTNLIRTLRIIRT